MNYLKDGDMPVNSPDLLEGVDRVEPGAAARVFLDVLADRAVIVGEVILRLREFNVAPNVDLNILLGRGLAHDLLETVDGLKEGKRNFRLMSVENSAPYFSFAVALGLQEQLGQHGLSIVRVRKLDPDKGPSIVVDPGRLITTEVRPITGRVEGAATRVLYAEIPSKTERRGVDLVIGIDDVVGTGDSQRGARDLASQMFPGADYVGGVVFSKAQQLAVASVPFISLLTIDHFGWENDAPILDAVGFNRVRLNRVFNERLNGDGR